MKRGLALLLVLLMLASCASETISNDIPVTQQDDATAVMDVPTETEREAPVPEKTYDGKEFHVMIRKSGYAYDVSDAFSDELTGEIVNDAVYNRNLEIEDKYNFKFVPNEQVSPVDTAQTDFRSGSQGYDVMTDQMTSTFPLALKNYFFDYNSLTYLNPSDPWWDPNISRDLTVKGKLFAMAGDIINQPMFLARFVYFNKGIIDEYGLFYPYDDVREGTWTIAKMTDMVAAVSTDLDGNGKMTADDRLGLLKETPDFFIVGLGVSYTQNDEKGIPQVSCINERTIAAIEAVHKMFDMPDCTLSFDEAARGRDMSGYPHQWEYVRAVFYATNHFLFVQNGASEAQIFRDMEPGYGVLPNPKLDEEQSSYYHLVDQYSCAWFMPSNPVDVDFTDAIFTAWAFYSDEVVDAYYEKTLKHKRLNAQEDAEMLDIIRSSLRYEISLICNLGVADVISSAYNTGNLASAYASSQKRIDKLREKTFKDIGD